MAGTQQLDMQDQLRAAKIQYMNLEAQYQRDIERLDQLHQAQMAAFRNGLQNRIREGKSELERHIREEMAALQRETAARMRQLEEERDRQLDRLQKEYQSALEQLTQRIERDETKEKKYAEEQRKAAIEAIAKLRNDANVQQFLPDAVSREQERLNSGEQPFRNQLYPVAAARWFTVIAGCAADQLEARIRKERWDRRRHAASERLKSIEQMFKTELESAHSYEHVMASVTESPAAWLKQEERMERLVEALQKARKTFETAQPGQIEAFDMAELMTFGLEDEIEALAAAAKRKIRNFLCCEEMKLAFFDAAGEDWMPSAGTDIERVANRGTMTLSNGLDDRIEVRFFSKQDEHDQFVVIALYLGQRANGILQRRLQSVMRDFMNLIQNSDVCGMQTISTNDFTDQGCPGMRVELRLMSMA